MKKLVVLVDMDDCIEGLAIAWSEYLNNKYDLDVPYEAIAQWDVSVSYPTLTREQVYEPLLNDDFWDLVKPISGAADALIKLKEDGHDVLIVTASAYQTLKAKMEKVLFRYFPFLTWDDVIVTSKKYLVAGDVLVDDGPHNLCRGSYRKILMSAMHNLDFDEDEVGAIRVWDWGEAYNLITEYASLDT